MQYLSILQELFESDTIIFLFIGIVIAVIVGLCLKKSKSCFIGIVASVIVYLICELASCVHTNFMLEFILLFVGTAAIGCCIGFMISVLIKLFH